MSHSFGDPTPTAVVSDAEVTVPSADSSANSTERDVIGNKTDTTSGNSLVSLSKLIKAETDQVGTVVNTGGTATLGAVIGDAENVTLVSRLPRRLSSVSITTNANNTTASVVCFTLTGSILVRKLYGVVTTALSSNHTAAHWRMNDQTNTPAVTLATGTTLSSADVGSLIVKKGLASSALTLLQADQVRVSEPTTLETLFMEEFTLTAKNGATTTLDYRYSTTNAPASGVIQVFCEWEPLSANASLV